MAKAMPHRLQRRRAKGWRMPEGAIYVGRPTRWGNPWHVGDGEIRIVAPMEGPGAGSFDTDDIRWCDLTLPGSAGLTAEMAVALYRDDLESILTDPDPESTEVVAALAELRGKDLVCWCPLNQPCHADVLLEVANRW